MSTVRFEGRYQLVLDQKSITTAGNEEAIRQARETLEKKDGGFAHVYTTNTDVFITTGEDTKAYTEENADSLARIVSPHYSDFEEKFTKNLTRWTGSIIWNAFTQDQEWQSGLEHHRNHFTPYFFNKAEKVELPKVRW